MPHKSIIGLTDEEYREFAETHIRYELDMLIGSASLCDVNIPIEGNLINFTLHNMAIESFSIHARSLIFFSLPRKKYET